MQLLHSGLRTLGAAIRTNDFSHVFAPYLKDSLSLPYADYFTSNAEANSPATHTPGL
jgi:hypothetical protein